VNEPTVQEKTNTISDWLGIKPNYFENAVQTQQSFLSNPLGTIGSAIGAAGQSFKDVWDLQGEKYQAYKTAIQTPGTSLATKVSTGLGVVTGRVALLFSPISAAFAAAEKLPVLQDAATLLNIPFSVTGKVGAFGADQFTNVLPIDQTSKDTLRPAFEEVGSLAGQILLGGKMVELISKGKKVDTKTVKKAVEEVKKIEPQAQAIFDKKVAETTKLSAPKEPIRLNINEYKPVAEPVKTVLSDPLTLEAKKYASAEEFVNKSIEKLLGSFKSSADKSYILDESVIPDIAKNVKFIRKEFPNVKITFDKKYKDGSAYITATWDDLGYYSGSDQIYPIAIRLRISNHGGSWKYADQERIELNHGDIVNKKEIFDLLRNQIQKHNDEIEKGINLTWGRKNLADKTKFLSKSQLTDIWNKAQEVKPVLPTEPPKTPVTKPEPIKTDKLQSQVYQRLKRENPQLEGNLAYSEVKLKEDAQRAVDLIATDKQRAYDIAMGKEKSAEITQTSANIAMAEKALQDGNNALYARLVKNRSLEQTRRGQELVAEKGSITDNSTSRYVKELVSERLDKVGKGYLEDLKTSKKSAKQKAVDRVDKEVAKLENNIKSKKLDMDTALSLLEKLTCVV